MTAPGCKYTLHYFDLRARGELPRLLFKASETPFVDKRYNYEEPEWPEAKKNFPHNQCPVLEIQGNDRKFSQSVAMARYLATIFGFAGSSDLERYEADIAVAYLDEIFDKYLDIEYHFSEEQARERAEALKLFLDVRGPRYYATLNSLLNNNGYFTSSNQLTWAEIYYFEVTSAMESRGLLPGVYARHPRLAGIEKIVRSNEKLDHYLKTRADEYPAMGKLDLEAVLAPLKS